MSLIKITNLTNQLGISSRSLRYYEQIGLIKSVRFDTEVYRYYDEKNIERLRQIMVLRKMQISIKDIIRIYENEDMSTVVEVFVNRINTLDEEVGALTELRRITNDFLQTMVKNGINKISALPLLYGEMDRQLDVLEECKLVTYDDLSKAAARVKKLQDIRIVKLWSMRMLSSYIKESIDTKSDTVLFQKWLIENNMHEYDLGCQMRFEYIDTITDEVIKIVKVDRGFINNSPFKDIYFPGGLFAVVGIYQGDDIGQTYDALKNHIETNSENYMIDYPFINKTHIDCLGEDVLSPFDDKARYELYMPIKRRIIANVEYQDIEIIDDMSIAELEAAEKIITSEKIDLKTVNLISEKYHVSNEYHTDEEGEYYSLCKSGQLPLITNGVYSIPFRVDMEFKIAAYNDIRLNWGNTVKEKYAVIVNDYWATDQHRLEINDPFTGESYQYKNKGVLPINVYTKLTWIVGDEYLAVIINDEIRHIGKNYPYMQTLQSKELRYPISISGGKYIYNPLHLTIKSVIVSKLRPKIKIQIKKGDLSIMQKQSNNILPKLRQLADGSIGENFFFNGCMRYLMECIGREDISDFWISAYVTGDAYLFYYTPGHKRGMELCLTDLLFSEGDAEYAKHIFDIYGYECTYITRGQISENRQLFADMVKSYIDRGVPVIAVGRYPDLYGMCFPICGYEENGKNLLMSGQMSAEPFKLEYEKTSFDFIFIGDKKRNVTIEEMYKRSITQMPQIYSMKRPDYVFGHEGLYRWADDIETLDADIMIRGFTDYIVNIATNVSGNQFGIDLPNNRNCGELETYIKDISKIVSGMCQKYQELNDINGTFDISLETLQNPEKRKQIADKIREIGRIQEGIVEVFDKHKDVLKS